MIVKAITSMLLASLPVLTSSSSLSAHPGYSTGGADPRVEKLLKEAGVNYTITKGGDFQIGMRFENGRTQLAWILSDTSTLGALEIREIWSPGYKSSEPLPADVANRLLAMNSKVKLGAWQVQKAPHLYIAVFSAQISADMDQQSLLSALQGVTSIADGIEEDLTGKDDF